jgi:polysaccharide chain length determinant protein (PEP-CTERM system associated)
MEERSFHPLDYVSLLRRRIRWVVVPLALCTLGGLVLALVLPAWYRSEATLGVTSGSVSPDLVRSTGFDANDRVRALTQELFSRRVLDRVAREEGLAATMPLEQAVAEIRANTLVKPGEQLTKNPSKNGIDTFIISYVDRTPERSQRVTTKLAQVFVDETQRSREARAERSSEFLAAQLRESQDRLANIEERLRQKKEAYMGRLPEQREANLQMVASLSQRLESTTNALRGEQDRLTMIERQLDGMRQGTADIAPMRADVGPTTTQGRVALLQRQLAEARTMYTDKHPEVQRLQQELTDAREELKRGAGGGADRDDLLRTDPTYQALQADRSQARLRVAALQRDTGAMRAQISQYQQRVEGAPMVEQELASLTREYELEKAQYGQLSERHKAALVAEDLERKQGNDRFSLLYAAGLPNSPESPNRPRLILMAIALGLFLGIGLAAGREFLDRAVYDARSLSQFDVPVLAEIPRIPLQGV